MIGTRQISWGITYKSSVSIYVSSRAPFYGLTLIPKWIRNYIHWKLWDEITLSILKLNGGTIEVWECSVGPDLGKNWVGLGKLSNLVARRSMVYSCVLLDDSITGLQVHVYTVGLWWIILDRWSMISANTILHTGNG